MKSYLLRQFRHPRFAFAREFGFLLRGIFWFGRKHRCPVCEWYIRGFVGERAFLQESETGYCPRCNAKARHRRIWLYLQRHTKIFSGSVRLLEVAPWWSFARRLQRLSGIVYVGVDLRRAGSQVTALGDLSSLPILEENVDVVLCIHVLEHVEDDTQAIMELYRVLRPGGVAIVSVPIRLDRPTYEDPSITDPEERKRHFGERGHVRYYGADFADRLRRPGFTVSMDPADALDEKERRQFGLRSDENIFHCIKPAD